METKCQQFLALHYRSQTEFWDAAKYLDESVGLSNSFFRICSWRSLCLIKIDRMEYIRRVNTVVVHCLHTVSDFKLSAIHVFSKTWNTLTQFCILLLKLANAFTKINLHMKGNSSIFKRAKTLLPCQYISRRCLFGVNLLNFS